MNDTFRLSYYSISEDYAGVSITSLSALKWICDYKHRLNSESVQSTLQYFCLKLIWPHYSLLDFM